MSTIDNKPRRWLLNLPLSQLEIMIHWLIAGLIDWLIDWLCPWKRQVLYYDDKASFVLHEIMYLKKKKSANTKPSYVGYF